MSVTRRAFAKFMGAAPLAAPAIAKAVSDMATKVAAPSVAQSICATKAAGYLAPSFTPEQDAARAALDLINEAPSPIRANWLAEVEQDIACMRSWSPAYKGLTMRNRERERRSLVDRLMKIIYPPDSNGAGMVGQQASNGRARW